MLMGFADMLKGYDRYVTQWDTRSMVQYSLPERYLLFVIVMTFWYVYRNGLTFFSNFLNFILHLGLITTPHVLYVHMTYVYSFTTCFILHTITWPREVIIVL